MKENTYISLFFLALCIFLSTRPVESANGGYSVDFKNTESRQVLVTVPPGETVTPDDDFAVTGEGGEVIASVYPFEVQKERFWSQPLSPGVLSSIAIGASVVRSPLSGEKHRAVRDAGSAQ